MKKVKNEANQEEEEEEEEEEDWYTCPQLLQMKHSK